MEDKIVSIKGFKAVGITYFGNNSNGEIPRLWEAFNKRYKDIKQKSKSMLFYGICDECHGFRRQISLYCLCRSR